MKTTQMVYTRAEMVDVAIKSDRDRNRTTGVMGDWVVSMECHI